MPGPESWVSQISLYIPSLPLDLVSFFFWVIYKRQVKLWWWASSRRKSIVNRNKVIEHFSKFLLLPSPICCMLFVLNSVFHWVFLNLMMNYSHWFLCLVRFHVQNTKQWTLVLCWRLLNVIWGFVFYCFVGLLLWTVSVH